MTAASSHTPGRSTDYDEVDPAPSDEADAGTTPSWLDTLTDDDTEPEESSSLSLFEGDTGELNLAQRKTLVALLKHRFITAANQPTEWRVLLDAETLLRSRLNDLFLDLCLDRNRQVAFKRQAIPEAGGRFPTLLHDIPWGREETILLIFLRTRFRSERNDGADDVIVDRAEMLERVAQFRPTHATDVSGDDQKTKNAVEALRRTGILVKTSDDHRLLVSPVIEVLLPVEKLHQLLEWFLGHPDATDEHVADSTGNEEVPALLVDSGDIDDTDDTDDIDDTGVEDLGASR